MDPRAGRITVGAFARTWLEARTVRGRPLSPRTVETYRYLLDRFVLPAFGDTPLAKLTPADVRTWHRQLLATGPRSVAPKAYRVLHAVVATAVDGGLIGANPCRVRGASGEQAPERPLIGPGEVAALADGIEPRWRALVFAAAYGGLRYGELMGLRRADVDPEGASVTVRTQVVELADGTQVRTGPKSAAGQRTVSLPRRRGARSR